MTVAPAEQLEQLTEELRIATIDWDPMYCSALGMAGAGAAVPDLSEHAMDDLAARFTAVADRIADLPADELHGHDRHTREIALWQATLWARICRSRREEWSVSPYKAFALPAAVTSMLPKTVLTSADEAQAFTARCAALPAALQTAMGALRRGGENARNPVQRLVGDTIDLLDRLAAAGGTAASLREIPVSEDLRGGAAAWRDGLDDILRNELDPVLRRYRDFLAVEVLPRSRPDEKSGVCWTSGGDESYQLSVGEYTTTDLTADRIHEMGLATVELLADEIRPVARRVFGIEDIGALSVRLREDETLRYPDSAAIVAAAQLALDRGVHALGALVTVGPRNPCGVRAMPEIEAPRMMPAYYRPGNADGSRPSLFWINTYEGKAARRYEVETLTFHESVPGHHLQFSLAREVGPQSRYRSEFPNMAFIEGWAVYCESIADSLGLLTSDLSRLGSWSALSWRASRLVVDTGLHAKGWSRQQAIDYMVATTALSRENAEGEVDRYIGNPGQALAYMTGMLRIQDARHRAEKKLGAAFDQRRFHDVLLGQGCPTLGVIDTVIDEWITSISAGRSG